MALSQPRSDYKLDEAPLMGGIIHRDATQDELNSDHPGDTEDKERTSDTEEPLSHWRRGGNTIPREFQGRSTSSFINRLVSPCVSLRAAEGFRRQSLLHGWLVPHT